MNIFYLDEDPVKAAQYMCDKHVVKMIVESAQILSTAHRVLDGELKIIEVTKRKIKKLKTGEVIDLGYITKKKKHYALKNERLELNLYKATHINHPSCKWVRENADHYTWLYDHFVALCEEYTFRYSKIHKTEKNLGDHLDLSPFNISYTGRGTFKQPPLAMDDKYKITGDAVIDYRYYYRVGKAEILKYNKGREAPHWLYE